MLLQYVTKMIATSEILITHGITGSILIQKWPSLKLERVHESPKVRAKRKILKYFNVNRLKLNYFNLLTKNVTYAETSQLNYIGNQLTGFCVIGILVVVSEKKENHAIF